MAGLLALVPLALLGCGGGGTTTTSAVWWLAHFDTSTHRAAVVIAHGHCEEYDHYRFHRRGQAVTVEVYLRSTSSGPCTAQLETSEVDLQLPAGVATVLGGCVPDVTTAMGHTCAVARSVATHQPVGS